MEEVCGSDVCVVNGSTFIIGHSSASSNSHRDEVHEGGIGADDVRGGAAAATALSAFTVQRSCGGFVLADIQHGGVCASSCFRSWR